MNCMNLDRFSQGLPDPQDADVLYECDACGAEIYPGEDVFVVNGDIICADLECLRIYADPRCMKIEEALGRDE
jgi:hypothetical protein